MSEFRNELQQLSKISDAGQISLLLDIDVGVWVFSAFPPKIKDLLVIN